MKNSISSRSITILGVTGSIGACAVDIIRDNPDLFQVTAMVANNNYKKLIEIAKIIRPKYVCIVNKHYLPEVKDVLLPLEIEVLSGSEGLDVICEIEVDICISAIMGFSGFSPTLKMIKNCSLLAIANKESIVCGGKIFIEECKAHDTEIIPLDSEHNSIYQLLGKEDIADVNEIVITASGGPFLKKSIDDLDHITVNEALNHPNWKMGEKITVDSATLVNKGLEIIETYFLFNISKDKINAIIHPESIIHALVSFSDGAVKSLLSTPDMRVAISYALGYPTRIKQPDMLLNINKISSLNFLSFENSIKHRAIDVAKDVLEMEGIMPIVFNAANEVFVHSFLENKIKFTDIVSNIERVLNQMENRDIENFDHIYEIDLQVRNLSYSLI